LCIGGGDTGSDCVVTYIRHGAKAVNQIEIFIKPPVGRTDSMPWPMADDITHVNSHEEVVIASGVLSPRIVGDKEEI